MELAMIVETEDDLDAYDKIIELKKLKGNTLEEQAVVKKSLYDLKEFHE